MGDKKFGCGECVYWLEQIRIKSRDNKKRGECRKSEPTLGNNGYGYWPLTAYDEYCFAGLEKDKDGEREIITG